MRNKVTLRDHVTQIVLIEKPRSVEQRTVTKNCCATTAYRTWQDVSFTGTPDCGQASTIFLYEIHRIARDTDLQFGS